MDTGGWEAATGETPLSRLLFQNCDMNEKEEKHAEFHFCTLHLVVIIHARASLNTKWGKYYSCSDFTR